MSHPPIDSCHIGRSVLEVKIKIMYLALARSLHTPTSATSTEMFVCVYFGAFNEFCSSPGFTQTLNTHLDVVWHFGLDARSAIKSLGRFVCVCALETLSESWIGNKKGTEILWHKGKWQGGFGKDPRSSFTPLLHDPVSTLFLLLLRLKEGLWHIICDKLCMTGQNTVHTYP